MSFNIGRVRRADEPPNAAFAYAEQNFDLEHNFVKKQLGRRSQCPADSGCSNIKTTKRREQHSAEVETWLLQTGDDSDNDTDWEYQSEEDNEPLEWGEIDDVSETSGAEAEAECDPKFRDPNTDLSPKLNKVEPARLLIESEALDSSESSESGEDNDDKWMMEWQRCQNLEHLAGPGCIHPRGYNGNNITAEEMFGACTVQCLVRKDGSWLADPNDEEFELSSGYFLSGLGGHMDSRDTGGLIVIPIRHGLDDEIRPDDEIFGAGNEVPMPFHPACLEVYRRVSQLRFGTFNVSDLWQWRLLEGKDKAISHCDPAVQRALGGEWLHRSGDEWLTANPTFVPALPQILQNAVYGSAASVNASDSAFPTCRAGKTSKSQSTEREDCFGILPQEVLFQIILTLRSLDIAALRLASRTFTDLPILLWKKLLKKEMPWLWEVWDHSSPYKWTAVSFSEVRAEEERICKVAAELRHLQSLHRRVIQEEMPGNWQQYCMDHPWLMEDVDAEVRVVIQQSIVELGLIRSIYLLPQDRTNWYEVYRLVVKHWDQLKGLRNRQRIWNICEAICDRIQKLREERKIAD